jgi:fucose permease
MLPLCFSAFVCFGMVLVLVGANQAEIAGEFHLDLARSGLLGSALAVGLGIGFVAAGPLFDRLPRRPLYAGAALLAAAALLGVDSGAGYGRLLLHIAATGLGIASYATFNSALVAERYREHSARPMTIVHAAATLGALLGPALVGALAARHHWTASFQWTGAAHLGIAAWAFFAPFPASAPRIAGARDTVKLGLRRFFPELLPFAAVAFAYVGIESTLTVFAVPYAGEGLGLPPERGRTAISGLWLGLLAGRMVTAALPGRRGPRLLVAAGALGCACVLAGTVSASTRVVALFGVVGFALGCVYPLMIALAGQQFPGVPGTAAGLAGAAGALGGSLVPWLTGVIGDAAGVAAAIGSMAFWSVAIAAGGAAVLRLAPPAFEDLG